MRMLLHRQKRNWKFMFRNEKGRVLSETIRFCINLSWRTSRCYTFLRILFYCLISITPVFSAYIMKRVLDTFARFDQRAATEVVFWICGFSVLKITECIAGKCEAYIESIHSELMRQRCSEILLEKAIDADLEMFDTPEYYDIFTETQNNMQALTAVLWNILEVLGSLPAFLAALIVLSQANWIYSFLIILASIPTAVSGEKYVKSLYQNDLMQVHNTRKQNYLYQVGTSKNYAQEIRCYGIGKVIKSKYQMIFSYILTSRKKILSKRILSNIGLLVLSEVVLFVLSIQIAYGVFGREYTIGDYSMYTSMLLQLNGTIGLLVMRIMSVYENKMKADFMMELSSLTQSRIVSGTCPVQKIERIEFEHVSFAYPGAQKNAVTDISFVLSEDTKTALVGVNGAGKSTVIKLLLRLYDPDAGVVRINDLNIKEYDLCSLREQVGVYTQNSPVFDWSLGENIGMMGDEYQEEFCRKALEKCGGKDILERSGGKMETDLGRAFSDKGLELSVGQKQKVALARAFYNRDQSVYILDEPSSSLDPETEKKVFDSIEEVSRHKIVLFTTHRIAAINRTDYIIVLEDGKITEEGNEETLIAKRGKFYQLYSCQL